MLQSSQLTKNKLHPYMMADLVAKGVYTEKEFIAFVHSYKSKPLEFYCPNGKQEEFINTVATCNQDVDTPVILVTYANGVGKTTTSIQILMNFIYGPQNGWFDQPLFKNFPYPKHAWYCCTADALKNKVVPEIEKLAKMGTYVGNKGGKPYTSEFKFNDEFLVHLKTFDQDPKTFESADVGIVILDEPCPENIWKAIKSRRRMGCIILLPMTPLYCDPYIIDEVAEGAENDRGGYHHLDAEVYDACQKRGIRGHLEAGIIDSMVADYDDDEYAARAKGKFMYFSRSIYGSNISKARHFRDPDEFPIHPEAKLLQIVDPHDGRYSASIWMAINPDGRRIIFDEYPRSKKSPFWKMHGKRTTSEEVRDWIAMENLHPFIQPKGRNVGRVLDKRFGWQTRGDTNFATLYAKAGKKADYPFNFKESYSISGAETEIQYGHRMVREAFRDMPVPNDPNIEPGLIIWNTCYHTWNGLSHYIRKMEVTKAAADKAVGTGIIVEKYKDFPDVIRYGVCTSTPPPRQTFQQREQERVLDEVFNTKKKVARW